jgi:hypothetical protein
LNPTTKKTQAKYFSTEGEAIQAQNKGSQERLDENSSAAQNFRSAIRATLEKS